MSLCWRTFAFITLFISVCSFRARSQTHNAVAAQLKEGDILFQSIPCGSLCQAIIETTPCKPGRLFNHCGIVHLENNQAYVIEAIGKAVTQTPLSSFVSRDTAYIIYAGRLKNKAATHAPVALAQRYIGTPYDNAFLPGDTSLYCSELVWECYKDNKGHVFQLQPMTFKSPGSGITYPAWAAYYRDLNREIPEGLPGINPCAIANSDKIRLIAIKK